MTDTKSWGEIEEGLATIALIVENRCYPAQSVIGARYICLLIRRELYEIDKWFLELDYREKEVK